MNAGTLTAIIQAFNSASDDMTRYHICHVLLFAEKGRVQVVATDGHILSRVSVDDSDVAIALKSDRFLVSPEALPALKMLAKEFKHGIPMKFEDGALVVFSETTQVQIKTEKTLGIEYPDYLAVWPKVAEDAFSVDLNPELLMSLFKALKEDKRQVGVTLVFRDKLSPILVEVGGNSGVLMPMRLGRKAA